MNRRARCTVPANLRLGRGEEPSNPFNLSRLRDELVHQPRASLRTCNEPTYNEPTYMAGMAGKRRFT